MKNRKWSYNSNVSLFLSLIGLFGIALLTKGFAYSDVALLAGFLGYVCYVLFATSAKQENRLLVFMDIAITACLTILLILIVADAKYWKPFIMLSFFAISMGLLLRGFLRVRLDSKKN